MNKFIVILLVAIAMGGCTTMGNPQSPKRVICWQSCVTVHVVNNCAPYVSLESPGRLEISRLPFGGSYTVVLVPTPLGGRHREMSLIAKAYSASGQYLGSASEVYRITNRGSEEEVWTIDRLDSPRGSRNRCG